MQESKSGLVPNLDHLCHRTIPYSGRNLVNKIKGENFRIKERQSKYSLFHQRLKYF